MTISPVSTPPRALVIGLPLLVMLICTVLALHPAIALHSERLSTGITIDLIFTAPLLYWLVIRKSSISRASVARVFVLGVMLAGLLLRNRPHTFLSQVKTWGSPVVEAAILYFLVRRINSARRSLKNGATLDFLSQGRQILGHALGSQRAGDVIMSELAVFYYVFRGRAGAIDYRSVFSYHKGTGILPVLGVLLTCFVVETAGVHFLIGLWSWKAAWIMTALGAYTTLQLFAHMRAILTRPIVLDGGMLRLYNGLAAEVVVPVGAIESVGLLGRQWRPAGRKMGLDKPGWNGKAPNNGTPGEPEAPEQKELQLGLVKAFERPNTRIRLRDAVTVYGPFGIRRKADTLLFFVDRPEDFIREVQNSVEGFTFGNNQP